MVSSDDLDPSLFPFQDMRYKGNRGGNTGTKPKQKKGGKPATTFVKPLAPVQSGVSVSNSGGIGAMRGEKDKPKRRATPSPSPVRGGAVGGRLKEIVLRVEIVLVVLQIVMLLRTFLTVA